MTSRKAFALGCVTGTILGTVLLLGGAVLLMLLFRDPLIQIMAQRQAAELRPPPMAVQADYDWEVLALDGAPLHLAALEQQPLFLHFWSPTCLTCVAEVPSLNRLHEHLEDSGVAMVTVVAGEPGDAGEAAARLGVRFPVYALEGPRPDVFVSRGSPTTFVIAPGGEIVYRQIGGAAWDAPETVQYLRSLVGPGAI